MLSCRIEVNNSLIRLMLNFKCWFNWDKDFVRDITSSLFWILIKPIKLRTYLYFITGDGAESEDGEGSGRGSKDSFTPTV